jgi:hypothetical protein
MREPKALHGENILCKPQAAEVGLAFEAFKGFAEDGLNRGHFIAGAHHLVYSVLLNFEGFRIR